MEALPPGVFWDVRNADTGERIPELTAYDGTTISEQLVLDIIAEGGERLSEFAMKERQAIYDSIPNHENWSDGKTVTTVKPGAKPAK